MNNNIARVIQPHGFTHALVAEHCLELDELTEHIETLSATLNKEYKDIHDNFAREINGFLDEGLTQGNFRDALTRLTGKPYLDWDFSGNRNRYWRMLTSHTYQQFSSRHQRSKLVELVNEWGVTESSQELWDEIKKRKIKTDPHQLANVLAWKKNGKQPQNKITPVPIDYSTTDSSMIAQDIDGDMVRVSFTCVRKEAFEASYRIPPHIVSKYQLNKISKPVFSLDQDGKVKIRFTVYTESQEHRGDSILGVDLGKVKPFSGSSISPDGYYSQELVCSKELEHLSSKLDRLLVHKECVYHKKMRLYSLVMTPYQPDPSAIQSYQSLCEEYVHLRSRIARVKEHMGWLIARDVVAHAINNHCSIINVEDLSWLGSQGGKWNHSDTQSKIEHTAASHGVRVNKVDAHGTSWEYPEEYETNPVPRSLLDSNRRELMSPVTGERMDKDRTAGIAIACRPRRKPGKKNATSNRKRVIQPKKCRDKHSATPKRPRMTRSKIVVNKTIPQYASVTVDTIVEGGSSPQVVKNTQDQTPGAIYPLLSYLE